MSITANFTIDYPESTNKTISTSPKIYWDIDNNGATGIQLGRNVGLVRNSDSAVVVERKADSTNTNKYFLCPPLNPDDYTLTVSLLIQGESGYSSDISYLFTIAKFQENIIRWEKTDSTDAFSFDDYWHTSNVDFTTNPERIKLTNIGNGFIPGYAILNFDSGGINTAWKDLNSTTIIYSDSRIETYARVSGSPFTEYENNWQAVSGKDLTNFTGQYLQIKYILFPDSTNSITPLLDSVIVTYVIPAISGSSTEKSIYADLTDTTKVNYNNTENINNSIQLKATGYSYVYNSPGELLYTLNLENPVIFDSLILDKTTSGSTTIQVEFRAYSNKNKKGDYKILTESAGTYLFKYDYLDDAHNIYKYLDLKITFTGDNTTGTYVTSPIIRSLKINWRDILTTGVAYAFTTKLNLDDNLKSIFLTANTNESETELTEIEYGLNLSGSVNYETDFQAIEVNTLTDSIENNGIDMRVGIKLVSHSLIYYPKVHELGWLFEVINKNKSYYNV